MKRYLLYFIAISICLAPFIDEQKQVETVEAVQVSTVIEEKIEPLPQIEIVRWAIVTSPHSGVSVDTINMFLAHLQDKGLTKEGSAYLVGNYIAESRLVPCGDNYGDGGYAYGLGQWHPDRRTDMPCDALQQLDWSIDTEMPRDASQMGYTCLCEALYTADIQLIKHLTQKWERWGIEGKRWYYSEHIYNQL